MTENPYESPQAIDVAVAPNKRLKVGPMSSQIQGERHGKEHVWQRKTLYFFSLVLSVAFWQCANSDDTRTRSSPRYVLQWGSSGSAPGEFNSPVCIAISSTDEVFVADLNNARIQQFSTSGGFVSQFELTPDNAERKSCLVGGMAIGADGFLYMSFMIQHRIGVFTKTGNLVRQWGKKGSADGEFFQPGGLVLRSDDSVVVADQCNHRVQEFTLLGDFLRKWGKYGDKVGEFGAPEPAGSRFAGPHFLTEDTKGRLYTTEGARGRIQQFDARGNPLSAWGSKTLEPGAFGEYRFGNLKNSFGPIGVFADGLERIWVRSLNDRVQAFTADGTFLFRLDGPADNDKFTHPHGMAQDSQGYLYVADSGNQRIVKFELRDK
jgi:sugar lactone lactonase YvrE